MRASHLAVVFPAKGLPRNTVQACEALWTRTSRMLLPGLGKFYDRFHPAAQPWGVDIPAPFSVVLGWDDPALFLHLYLRAREYHKESLNFHVDRALDEMDFKLLKTGGGILICPVTLDGTNKRLEAHIFWHAAMAQGVILPDCGAYYAERKRSAADVNFEKSVESAPADYALSMVTMERMEDSHGV